MKNSLNIFKLKWLQLLVGPLLFVLLGYLLPFHEMSSNSRLTLGIVAWMAFWWITEVVAIEATALLPLILFPIFGILDLKSAAIPYAHPYIFLFFGGFILALAIEKWDLHKRIAVHIIRFVGTKPKQLIGGVMVATAFLSMWISNTATAVMMLPIALSVIKELAMGENSKFSESMLLGVAYSASIGGMATIIGTPPNLVFVGFMEQKLGRVV
jgi:sodium-dependent dicarboxylate transporter 2/3/5